MAGQFDAAAKHFTAAIENDPTDHVFFSNRSACYASVGKLNAAIEDAEKCVELKPDWDKAHFRKAAALEASEKDAEALIALEVRKNPRAGLAEPKLCRNRTPRRSPLTTDNCVPQTIFHAYT